MKKALIALLAVILLILTVAFSTFADETAERPTSFTLVGSEDLPPISDQGQIGCCASAAITYKQFTNAVSKYLRANYPDMAFDPTTGAFDSVMSPKWTFQFGGAGTAWVYDILVQQGCVKFDDSAFVTHPTSGAYQYFKEPAKSHVYVDTLDWDIGENNMEEALKIRLKDYDQVWMDNNYMTDGKVLLTQTEKGQALINRIKDSLVDGNVVVTGGFSGSWQYTRGLSKSGTLGKRSEWALYCCRGAKTGGHQVSIVGYDDEIVCKVNGATMTGAFLVANSWGQSWMNKGYVWLMYDALNEVSEYEALNFDDRIISMDQFCFVDWRNDIAIGLPDLYVEAEVECEDRESPSFTLTRTGTLNKSATPNMFISSRHEKFEQTNDGGYLNFDGVKNGGSARAVFDFNYNNLLDPEMGKSLSDYSFGVNVTARSGALTLYSLKLKNSKGEVISEIELPDEGKQISSLTRFVFDTKTYAVSLAEGTPIVLDTEIPLYGEGKELSFGFTIQDGFVGNDVRVFANDEELTADENGKYSFTLQSDTVLTFSGIEKEEVPVTETPTETPAETETPVTPTLTETPTDTPDEPTQTPDEPTKTTETVAPTETKEPSESASETETPKDDDGGMTKTEKILIGVAVGAVAAVAAGAVAFIILKKKK